MKIKLYAFLPLCIFVFLQKTNAQDVLNFTAIKAEGYGTYAASTGHQIPLPVCGLNYAYYRLKSPDNAGLSSYHAGMHLVSGGTGFPNFRAALTANGYTLDQVEMSFTDMTLGPDAHPGDWFISGNRETRQYRGGAFIFRLDGEDLVSGGMPTVRIVIDYGNLNDCFDDVISGHTMQTDMVDASGASSAGVQAVAAALLSDVGTRAISMVFSGMQPAAQGSGWAVFEATSGTITLETVHDVIFQSLAIAPGMASQCITANTSVNSTGSGDWLHIQHNNELVCSILDTENMGTINSSIYINPGNVRTTADGTEYLDRNFEISVANQPANPVRVRIYFKSAEWQAFLDANDDDGNDLEDLSDMKVTKFGNVSCSSAVNSSDGTLLDILDWGSSDNGETYFVDVEVNSFSAFFLHGGAQSILPVELIYFSAQAKQKRVMLEWATVHEENNDRFEVERSRDGFHFSRIGQKTGAGNQNGWQNYRFHDSDIVPGETYYYRLRQIDFDGTEEYSGIASVKIPGEATSAEVFPNPMGHFLSVKIPEEMALPVTVELVGVMGRAVLRRTFDGAGQFELKTSGLPNGIYEVVFSNGKEKWVAGKVVK